MTIFENYEIISLIYKALVFIALPVICAMLLAGFFAGLLQGVVTLREEAISYSIKIIVLTCVLYFIYPVAAEILVELVRVSLK